MLCENNAMNARKSYFYDFKNNAYYWAYIFLILNFMRMIILITMSDTASASTHYSAQNSNIFNLINFNLSEDLNFHLIKKFMENICVV